MNETSLSHPEPSPLRGQSFCPLHAVPLGAQRSRTWENWVRRIEESRPASTFRWEPWHTRQLRFNSDQLCALRRNSFIPLPFGGVASSMGVCASLPLFPFFNSCFLFLLPQFWPFALPTPPPAAMSSIVCIKSREGGKEFLKCEAWGLFF